MTLQFQILTMVAQILASTIIISGVLFIIGLIFEKPIAALSYRITNHFERKKAEKERRIQEEIRIRKEIDRRKVQRIRDNLNRELENTGTIYIPYYMAS